MEILRKIGKQTRSNYKMLINKALSDLEIVEKRANLMDEKDEIFQNEGNFNDNICLYSFRSYNYDFIPESLNHEFLFFYLCRYNYINLVQVLLQNEKVDVNRKLVLIFFLK